MDEILELIDQLGADEEEKMRKTLNHRFWQRHMEKLEKGDLAERTDNAWNHLIERMRSGDIDEDIKCVLAKTWQDLVQTIGAIPPSGLSSDEAKDPVSQAEDTYHNLESKLTDVRKAVAQAIATEKQVELQVSKNKEQSATWGNRAKMALQQHNEELARQANERKTHYEKSADDLETQLNEQKKHTALLRNRLTQLETQVQKMYTKKQVLIARYHAAKATIHANTILDTMTADDLLFEDLAKMEQMVEELESKIGIYIDDPEDSNFDRDSLLNSTKTALENATRVMENLEKLIVDKEAESKSQMEKGTDS